MRVLVADDSRVMRSIVVRTLRQAGLPDGERLLDDPGWVEWRGAPAHEYGAG